ncbi:hypothetical protein [Pseudomonas fulva]|uniref:hypothetical protein n=1 Tax=Pseudomonas fulva TaxID=47880 RepID=UPI0018AAFD21|nr:hypothetical protein [Pseudomonas fulva]MBF8692400.1 hypothetical protein [Pseudomonas fulva]
MALTSKQRDLRRREKQERLGEQDLRIKATAAHAAQLVELMAWAEMAESGEALTLLIFHCHKLGREKFSYFVAGARLELESDQHLKAQRTEIRLRARPGTVRQIEEMGDWINTSDRSFVIRLLIERAHALGPIQSLTLLSLPPRHKFAISDSVARTLYEWRIQRQIRAKDIPLEDDPDDTGLLLLGNG